MSPVTARARREDPGQRPAGDRRQVQRPAADHRRPDRARPARAPIRPAWPASSNLTAELLTEGTKTRTATQVAAATEALGADLAAGSGGEASSLTLSVIADKAPRGLAIMADVAQNPTFKADELERVQDRGAWTASPWPSSGLARSPASSTPTVIYAGSAFGHVAGGTPGVAAEDPARRPGRPPTPPTGGPTTPSWC